MEGLPHAGAAWHEGFTTSARRSRSLAVNVKVDPSSVHLATAVTHPAVAGSIPLTPTEWEAVLGRMEGAEGLPSFREVGPAVVPARPKPDCICGQESSQ